jgi:methyl-accepting chemotaxis protein
MGGLSVRTKWLAMALLLQGAPLGSAMLLGPSASGWAASIILSLIMLALLDYFLCRNLIEPQDELSAVMERVKMEGDLALRLGGNGSKAEQLFNELLDSFRSIVGKVIFNSGEVAKSANQLDAMANQVAGGSNDQQAAAEAASQAIEQMVANIRSISEKACQAAKRADESRGLSNEGAAIARRAADEIERVAAAFEDSVSSINQLGQRSQQINGIAAAISEIAEQTNLLALNAAIEAARAGEQGRGFAVVADEVRKLAERTSSATKEISSLVIVIQTDTQSTIGKVNSGAALAREGTVQARQAADALLHVGQSCHAMLEESSFIANAITEQASASELAGQKVHTILELAEANSGVVKKMQGHSANLEHLAANLKEIDNVFSLGEAGNAGLETHKQAIPIAQAAARDIGNALERAVSSGKIKLDDLFDEDYRRIAGVEPAKFNTKFDGLTDQLFPSIQEPLLSRNSTFVYAGAVDRNGYFPTHNRKFSAAPTGDIKRDTLFSRTKRIFNDPVGKRCGSHDKPYLLQTYRRDTGEVMHDISAPIMVGGRQWGGFRIGYRA